ncbi:MAG: TIGR02206 family membrane protein [Clostridiales bacterium]|nr:TIGR02206 family membrane protein [Clostridiales bacterium]
MQYALLVMLGTVVGLIMRRIALWRRCGYTRAARRLYLGTSWLLGGGAYAAMATQEGILLASGQLAWSNALPLHLCSLMGLLTLPMLLTRRRILWHISLYLGLPGALMALLFPAVLETPWPRATELAFHTMHCCVLLAPLLPFSLGVRPSPRGVAWALISLALLTCVALGANAVTGGNYLFLNGSPIGWMNRWGLGAWRGALAALVLTVLASEAFAVFLLQQKRGWSH